MEKMRRIYHLHIPRTSGRSICDALYNTFVKGGVLHKMDGIVQSHLMYEESRFIEIPFVSGHFAKNPITQGNEQFDVFSIIREPVSHYVSIAAYVCANSNREMSNDFMEEFLYGYITPFGANELFSNSGNLQSKMLFCRIALADSSVVSLREADVQSQENIIFLESDMPDETEMKDQIANMMIFTLENRHSAINWLSEKIAHDHGLNLDYSVKSVSNASAQNAFKLDVSHAKEILKRCEIDTFIYETVKREEDANLWK